MEPMKYRLVRSDRRTISLEIVRGGELVVRAPLKMSEGEIDSFVESKRGWIEKHLPQMQQPLQPRFTAEELHAMADRALVVIPERVRHFAPIVGVTYGSITIRNQRTKWGSCSGKGNLNFNCLLMLTPPEIIDYVVVHELCHRIELNHSPRFWAQVARVLPDYEARRRWQKENGHTLAGRL